MLRNKRKFIASSLAAVMIMGTIPTEANATFEKTDISGHWAESQISLMGDKGYIGGYPDNTFRPNKEITRAEFVAIVNNVFGYKNKKEIQLKDVKPEAWYYESIAIGINEGYIAGYPDGTFRPNKAVSREEAAAVIAKIKKLTAADNLSSIEKFKDAGKISK